MAHTFRNLSFELAEGTSGIVTSANAQPYDFDEGDALFIEVDHGDAQAVPFTAADFVDIDAATAAEVATLINASTTGCTAASTGTHVQIESDTEGDGSCVLVLGGSANDALGFPVDENCGVTTIGQADGWFIATTGAAEEWGGFDSAIFEEPFEDFEEGWSNNEDALFEFAANDLGSDDATESFETDWPAGGTFYFEMPATEAGAFDAVTPEVVEDFEEEWLTNETFQSEFVGVGTDLTAGTFDAEAAEDFEEQWDSNETFLSAFVGVGTDLEAGVTEGFETVTGEAYAITILVAVTGQYRVEIGGFDVSTPATVPADTTATIATAVASAISGSGTGYSAVAVGPVVNLTPTVAGTLPVVFVEGPTGGAMDVQPSSSTTRWTAHGQMPAGFP